MQLAHPEDETSEKAREGTAAHHVATEMLSGVVHHVGMLTPNGYPVTEEMVDGARLLFSDVIAETTQSTPGSLFRIETKVTAYAYVHGDNEGTPDCWLVDPGRRLIIVWDYKFGHRSVDAFRNWQLVNYLAGVLEGCHYGYDDLRGWTISLRIVQPRDYHAEPVKEWTFYGEDAFRYIGELANAARAAKAPNAPTIPGDYCRDCSAAHACEALRLAGGLAIDIAGHSTPETMDTRGMALELRALSRAAKRLDARRTALQEVIIAKIQAGERVPHWSLGRGETRERWTIDPEFVFAVGDAYGVNLRKEPAAITPPQARKAGVPSEIVATLAERPLGAVKLIETSERDVAKAFSK